MTRGIQPANSPAPAHAPAGLGGKLKHEFFSLLPAILFFLVGFNLIALSKHVILAEHGIVYGGLAKATIGALLVAKVVALGNLMPFVKSSPAAPLYISTLHRTLIYTALCMIVHELEGLVRAFLREGSITHAITLWSSEFAWNSFMFIAIWIFALFLLFIAFSELALRSGVGSWRRALTLKAVAEKP